MQPLPLAGGSHSPPVPPAHPPASSAAPAACQPTRWFMSATWGMCASTTSACWRLGSGEAAAGAGKPGASMHWPVHGGRAWDSAVVGDTPAQSLAVCRLCTPTHAHRYPSRCSCNMGYGPGASLKLWHAYLPCTKVSFLEYDGCVYRHRIGWRAVNFFSFQVCSAFARAARHHRAGAISWAALMPLACWLLHAELALRSGASMWSKRLPAGCMSVRVRGRQLVGGAQPTHVCWVQPCLDRPHDNEVASLCTLLQALRTILRCWHRLQLMQRRQVCVLGAVRQRAPTLPVPAVNPPTSPCFLRRRL